MFGRCNVRHQKLLFSIVAAFLLLVPGVARSGSNNLTSVAGGKVQTSHVNQYYTALNQVVVPRDSSGVPTDLAGSLGTSSIRWDEIYGDSCTFSTSMTVGTVTMSHNTSSNQNGLVSSGGSNGLFYPNTTSKASLSGSGTRTLSVRTSGAATEYPIVVSPAPSTHGLAIVRGCVTGTSGAISTGEGFTMVRNTTGDYTGTFSTSFADVPAITFSSKGSFPTQQLVSLSASSFRVITGVSATTVADEDFCFIASGQRGS